MRQIVLDTETTGLSFVKGHRIVEIGCVEIKNYVPTGKTFHTYIQPGRLMDPGAMQVSGITDAFLVDKPVFKDVVLGFLDFLEDSPLVIHNAGFDMAFINGELSLLKKPPLPMERAIDTVVMARKKFPGSPANLDALCRRFNVDLSDRTKHGALLDAKLLAEVYLQLVGGRQPDLILKKEVGGVSASSSLVVDRPYRAPRDFILSEDELEKHKTFIENLKEPLWRKFGS